ncbi:amino acid-binding protein [Candidatus Micrarchaeota archaeon]|nr:amino acid-binding protein [Candidatus Micrarchaeota archaeon]
MVSVGWEKLKEAFDDYPAQERVARKLLSLGLAVRAGKVYSGNVEAKEVSLAHACGVDRRAVKSALGTISSDKTLNSFFSTLEPAGPFYLNNASSLNLKVLEIEPPDASKAGIIADVTRVLAENKVSICQILSQDPGLFEKPKLFIILQKVPAKVLEKISSLKTVKKMSVY